MPTPHYGEVDGSTGLQTGYSSQAPTSEWTDPNNPGFLAASKRDPSFQYINGRWTKVGAPTSLDQWVEGVFSGRTDVFGKETAEWKAKREAAEAAKAAQQQQDQISARMQAFIDSMLGPMDQNDPIYKGLIQAGTDAAQRQAGQAGLAGRSTLAGTQAASVAQQNVLPWMQARQQAGQQMLGQLSNRDISLGNLSLGQQRVNQGLAESQYNANKNTMTTLGSIGGGILGGIYGGPGGATAGAQLGGAVLGTIGSGQAPAAAPTYRPGSGYKPSGPSGSGY